MGSARASESRVSTLDALPATHIESLTAPELVAFLRRSLDAAANVLVSRDRRLSEEMSLSAAAKAELETKCAVLKQNIERGEKKISGLVEVSGLVEEIERKSQELLLKEAAVVELETKCAILEEKIERGGDTASHELKEYKKRISGSVEDLERKSWEVLLKDAVVIKLEAQCERLEEELAAHKRKCSELEDKVKERAVGLKEKLKELENYKKICGRHDALIARMKEENRVACEREKEARQRIVELMWEIKTKEKVAKKRLFKCEVGSKNGDDELRLVEESMVSTKKQEMVEKEQGNKQSSANSRDENSEHFGEPITFLDLETSKPVFGMVVKDEMTVEADGSIDEFNNAKNESSAHKLSEAMQFGHTHVDDVKDNNSSSEENFLFSASSKRKRGFRVVTTSSEGEDDDVDDKLPIGQLVKKRLVEENGSNQFDDCLVYSSKNRLVTQPQCVATGGTREASSGLLVSSIPSPTGTNSMILDSNGTVYDKLGSQNAEDVEEKDALGRKGVDIVGSENGSESLDVHSINRSAGMKSPCNSSEVSKRVLDSSKIDKILAEMHWERDIKKWRYENDMLFSLEEDPVLCMQAVCAIYRQQMSRENSLKGTMHAGHQGFKPFDAYKGTMMAEFLLDGDPHGPLKKTLQELEMHDSKGLDYCRKLATHYSDQLFMIYQINEDPYFLSC